MIVILVMQLFSVVKFKPEETFEVARMATVTHSSILYFGDNLSAADRT